MKHITEWELKDLVQLALDKLSQDGFQADGEPALFFDGDKTEAERLLLRIPVRRAEAATKQEQPAVEEANPKRKNKKSLEELPPELQERLKKANAARAAKREAAKQNGHSEELAGTVEVVAAPVDPFR